MVVLSSLKLPQFLKCTKQRLNETCSKNYILYEILVFDMMAVFRKVIFPSIIDAKLRKREIFP